MCVTHVPAILDPPHSLCSSHSNPNQTLTLIPAPSPPSSSPSFPSPPACNMGNLLSCTGISRSLARDDVVKLVHSNGLVEEFYRSVRVGELSVDYPHHFICRSGDLRQIGSGNLRKLSEEENMELGQIYFLLPMKVLELRLTKADVAALFSKAGVARKASYKELLLSMQPQVKPLAVLEGQDDLKQDQVKRPQQPADVKVSRELIQKLIAETRSKLEMQLKQQSSVVNPHASYSDKGQARIPELQTAYARHVLERSYTKLWRPPLETIKEDSLTVS